MLYEISPVYLSLSFESEVEEENYQQLNNNKRPKRIRKKVFDERYQYQYELQCDHCTKTFQGKSALTAHVNTFHRWGAILLLTCNLIRLLFSHL